MKYIEHFYSLNPDWQYDFAKQMDICLIDDKIMIIPNTIGSGHVYFTQSLPGISVLVTDFTIKTPLTLNKLVSQEEFYMFTFSSIGNRVENANQFSLIISNNQFEESFSPTLNKKVFELSVFVEKNGMHNLISGLDNPQFVTNRISNINDCYTEYLDSDSLRLLQSVKNESIYNLSFEYFLRGVSLKLLANFLSQN